MRDDGQGIRTVTDEELRLVRGGSFWSRVKGAAVWVKDHVKLGLKSIGIGGKF